jgi:CheY-like chemotaxis protein
MYDYTVDSIKKSLFTKFMALRVLLADESTTIKKVVQLTLQDFDVDVRSVSVGLDVLSVTKTFKPDLIFADVLLAKRSGYEVCHDLKSDPETQKIPVVLMWSGFMEIDEQKARLSGADRRLEKPFDPSALRGLVQDLVKKTRDNPVSSFITFPPLPEFQESPVPAPAQSFPEQPMPAFSIPSAAQPLTQVTQNIPAHQTLEIDDNESDDEWIQKPPPQNEKSNETLLGRNFHAPVQSQSAQTEEFAEFPLTGTPVKEKITQAMTQGLGSSGLDSELVSHEIQKWLTKHMAPLAEKIIREEINRLLQDTEQNIEAP